MSADFEIVKGRLDGEELAALVAVLELHEHGLKGHGLNGHGGHGSGEGPDGRAAAPRDAERRPGPRWDPEGLSPPVPASAPRRPRSR
ncbi:hypothetical protein [Actinomadura sp. WMMA1423]|uniref:hypothetical protein n=1 Tax=Actinomadura sp. WMMA1423 TaxID=2591108 RepID=UPI00143DE9D3|nr:hypothetical protein [Actinomadura sp. WMMA1423]